MKTMIPTRYLLVFATFMLTLILYIDRVCISAAKGAISDDLGFSDTQMGWVMSAFALGYALMQIPSGLMSDRYGPRKILTVIVGVWSLFTALTGAVKGLFSMLTVRFLFGAGEAGAFPGISRSVYSWFPVRERGIVTGINFSGSRLGAAFAFPLVAWMVAYFGWRTSFYIMGGAGVVWAAFWYFWFRDDPKDHKGISEDEKTYILSNRQQSEKDDESEGFSASALFGSRNVWLAMFQYFSTNFITFFCLTWMFPYLQDRFDLSAMETGGYAMIPLILGAFGNWVSGSMVDYIYRKGDWKRSRSIPAISGFILVIIGIAGILTVNDVLPAVIFLSVAVFGADMVLSPSWSLCVDIGKNYSGTVSGTMNMAGNIGSFITGLAFPYLALWTGSNSSFFIIAGIMAVISIGCWLAIDPSKPIVTHE
ncbi:MAG: MFS transporter [Cyclobacteriaceae bacterium]